MIADFLLHRKGLLRDLESLELIQYRKRCVVPRSGKIIESFGNVHQGGQVTNNKCYVQSCEITELSQNKRKH